MVASVAFVASQLACEHLAGGVRSHNLLNRSGLPAISNWWGLFVLPTLGWLFGMRPRNHLTATRRSGSSMGIWLGLGAALLYGGAMAGSFQLGFAPVTSSLFLGLFLIAVALPVYRAEYVLGFVMGMTFTFGGVLPALVATVFATISFLVRLASRFLVSVVRLLRSPPDVA